MQTSMIFKSFKFLKGAPRSKIWGSFSKVFANFCPILIKLVVNELIDHISMLATQITRFLPSERIPRDQRGQNLIYGPNWTKYGLMNPFWHVIRERYLLCDLGQNVPFLGEEIWYFWPPKWLSGGLPCLLPKLDQIWFGGHLLACNKVFVLDLEIEDKYATYGDKICHFWTPKWFPSGLQGRILVYWPNGTNIGLVDTCWHTVIDILYHTVT